MRYVLTLMFALMSILTNAQSAGDFGFGIPLGSTVEETKSKLLAMNKDFVREEDGQYVSFDIFFAGTQWDFTRFEYEKDGGKTHLKECTFSKVYADLSGATQSFEVIKKELNEKYGYNMVNLESPGPEHVCCLTGLKGLTQVCIGVVEVAKDVCYSVIMGFYEYETVSDQEFEDNNPANKVTSVAGVEFGRNRSYVMSKLQERFGYDYTDFGNNIVYKDIDVGGVNYKFAQFYFSRKGLCCAFFFSTFDLNQFEKAKEFRDEIASLYGKKYKNIVSCINPESKIKYYKCGMIENDRYPILIFLEKRTLNSGKSCYYVSVQYFTLDEMIDEDI